MWVDTQNNNNITVKTWNIIIVSFDFLLNELCLNAQLHYFLNIFILFDPLKRIFYKNKYSSKL